MAYAFVRASSQYLSTASTPVSAMPVTLFITFNSDSSTVAQQAIGINTTGTAINSFLISVRGDLGPPSYVTDPILARQWRADTYYEAASTAGYSANVWSTAVAIFASSTSRTVYLNGGNSATNTSSILDPQSLGIVEIGAYQGGPTFSGNLSEAAIWSAALNASEASSLAKGFKPTRIRPQSLVFYAPLIRTLQDTRGGLAITNNNSATVADHPRVY